MSAVASAPVPAFAATSPAASDDRQLLRLLGAPALQAGDGLLRPLKAIDALLLARLALDGPQSRRSLARWLWPDATEARAATHLRQRLYRLKNLAGRPLVDGDAVIALSAALAADVTDLQAARADAVGPTGPGADDPLAAPLLGAFEFDDEQVAEWVATQRLALRTRQQHALAAASEAHAARGQLALAISLARQLVDLAPDNEHAHRRLMRLHFRRADLGAAEAAFARCSEWMRKHHGLAPSAETRELMHNIRRLATSDAPAPPQPAGGRLAALPVALLRPPTRVARDAEWHAVQRAIAQRASLLVVGEAGAGKTRLLEDALAGHTDWVRVGARPGDSALAFALLARLLGVLAQTRGRPQTPWVVETLAHLVPDWQPQLSTAPSPLRLRQALEAALAHWAAGGLAGLCVDDLHHADEASIATVAALMAAPDGSTPAWLVATRPLPDLEEALRERAPLRLAPLAAAAVEALVASLAIPALDARAWAPMLRRRAGGNPLFILQLLCSAHEQGLLGEHPPDAPIRLPASLLATVTDRLLRLGTDARALVHVAACADADFSLELAAQVMGRAAAELATGWRELENTGVMEGGAFVHDLMREAVQAWLPQPVTRTLHAQIAAALEDAGAPAPRRAWHWQAAGRWAQAGQAWAAAASDADGRGAVGEEIECLDASARCFGQAGDARRAFAAQCRAVRLKVAASQVGESTAAACAALLQQAADALEQACAHELRAYLHAERYEPEAALQAAEAALALLPGDDSPAASRSAGALPPATVTRLLATQRAAQALARLGRPVEALQRMAPWDAVAGHLPDRDRLNWRLVQGMALDYADRRTEALTLSAQTAAEAERLGLTGVAAEARGQQAIALIYLGRLSDSVTAAEQSIALARRAGVPAESLLVDTGTLATNLRDLGHFDRYLRLAEDLPARLRASGNLTWACNAEHDLAVAYAWLGRPERALQILETRHDDMPPLMQATRCVTRGRLASDFGVPAGDRTPAAWIEAAQGQLDALGVGGRSYIRLAIRAHAARHRPASAGARQAAGIAREALARENLPLAMLALSTLVRIQLAAGRPAAGAAHRLLALLARHGEPLSLYAPEAGWLAWQALQRVAPEPARAALADAAAWILRTAREHVPASFRPSFLERNPINRAVLVAAGR